MCNKNKEKENIIKHIRDSFYEANGYRNNRLQLPKYIDFQQDGEKTLVVMMQKQYVMENMQKNSAAFESWIFAIKRWTKYDKFVLSWETPINTDNNHYQRFLYRVKRFGDCYNWFSVHDECKKLLNHSKINNTNEDYILNVARSKSKEPNTSSIAPEKMSENELEWHIYNSNMLKDELKLKELHRQLPVGLFQRKVLTQNYIFSGKSSAIDLWGIDDRNNVLVFELKKFGNKPIGIISELFFYTMVIHDTLRKLFIFSKSGSALPDRGNPNIIPNGKKVLSFFLINKLHPLIDKGMIEIINKTSLPKPLVEFGIIKFGTEMNFNKEI